MRLFALLILAVSLFSSVFAQQGLEPKFDIPPTIAKLPEPSDFYGKWLRGDGGYRLEIEADAKSPTGVTARYFNPEPIKVESATFDPNAEQPTLIVVLRDQGYPGSTYRLIYLAERAVLVGSYQRPGSDASEVYFVNEAEQK